MTAAGQVGDRDAAWVVIETGWPADALRRFIDDVPRLIRINPMLVIERLEARGEELRLVARNESNGRPIDVAIAIARLPGAILLTYDSGLKASTRLEVEAAPDGARLVITDDYSRLSEHERRGRAGEVDLSLSAWGQEIRAYLASWRRWSWLAPWRWYRGRVWLSMSPATRRIARLLIAVTALELAVLVLALAFWRWG